MSELTQVLRHVVPVEDPNALVGHLTGDDAAVYRLSDDRAVVVTTDFFTPIVDDPYDFGRIAAANALSDVYAMGARPLFVLNLLGFPRKLLGEGLAERVLEGGNDVARLAGVPTLGGHSIDDPEPKFGMVAVGEVHPDRMVTNAGARPGDRLVLTKPIGSGVVATAIKRDLADPEVVSAAVDVMATLNRGAAETMVAHGVECATDVTGFGLMGHLHRLLAASGVAATVDSRAVPWLEGARALVEAGSVAGGTQRNREDVAHAVTFAADVDDVTATLLCDAQTSGGMLMCVPADRLDALLADLDGKAPVAAVIGEVVDGEAGTIRVS